MKIFVSYRRKDASHVAGRLRDRLVNEFGEPNIFFDVDSIDPGQRFAEVISERLGEAEVVLVLIGPNWQPELLARPDDYVRLELAEALDQQKRVVPVLVDDGALPTIDDLPDELAGFLTHNAAKLRQDPDFHEDADRLIEGVKPSQTGTRGWMAPRSKALRLVVAIGVILLLALLVGLAMRALGDQSDDGSSTDESTEIAAGLDPELRALVGVTSAYQPIVEVPVVCAGGEVEFSAGPAEWRDATGFRIPFAWRATGTESDSLYDLDAYDPAGNSWPIDVDLGEAGRIEIEDDGEGLENVESRIAGPQRDAAGIALVVTPLFETDCQEEFVLLRVSLDPPG